MMFRTLELRTEAMLMDGVSVFDDRGDHVIQRTPSEPDYWEGNRVILRTPSFPAGVAIAAHRAALPDATHLCFAFDTPDLPVTVLDPGFAAAGCEAEVGETLVLTRDLSAADMPVGLSVREVVTDEDWEAAHALATVSAGDEGYDPATHDGFNRRRNARRRALIAQGRGVWFGVFEDRTLVAQMGIFTGDGLARYQEVQTAARHRGRGIASALLGIAGHWARARHPGVSLVIVADAGAPAGRLYRRMGFRPAETTIMATKRGD